jgi:Uma2 family endonuclease
MATTEAFATPRLPGHIVLKGVSWATYEALRADLDAVGSNIQMTYNEGRLELMSPELRHESGKRRLGRIVETITEELNLPLRSGGSTTFKSQLLEKGLEPDECYWIPHEAAVRGKSRIDLDTDPPPDLTIEVENTRDVLDKLPIYAALGFPEIWRTDGDVVQVLALQPGATYREQPASLCLPFLSAPEIGRLFESAQAQDETAWIRGVRAWVQAELLPRFAGREEP